jgi:hypothetical protein
LRFTKTHSVWPGCRINSTLITVVPNNNPVIHNKDNTKNQIDFKMRYQKRIPKVFLRKTCTPIVFIVIYRLIAIVVMTVFCSLSQQQENTYEIFLEPLVQVVDDEAKAITSDSRSSSSIFQNLAQLESKLAVITAGDESHYPQVFYRGNTPDCGIRFDFDHDGMISSNSPLKAALAITEWTRLPMSVNGAAAGPLIDCTPSMVISNKCDVNKTFHELQAVKALREGKAFEFFLLIQPPEKSNAVVASRARMSSSTGVVFLDENHLTVASYGMQKVYLYEYHLQTSDSEMLYARLLDSVDATGKPDLMDVDLERKLLVVSQLMMGL